MSHSSKGGRGPMATVREAAEILGVNIKTIYEAIRKGTIPAIRIGRVIRISRSVLASMTE